MWLPGVSFKLNLQLTSLVRYVATWSAIQTKLLAMWPPWSAIQTKPLAMWLPGVPFKLNL